MNETEHTVICEVKRLIVAGLSAMKLSQHSVIFATSSLLMIALVDYLTGNELQFFVFYFIPLFVISSNKSRFYGYLLAIIKALCRLEVDVISGHSSACQSLPRTPRRQEDIRPGCSQAALNISVAGKCS